MTRLNFSLPEFTRIVWASDKAKQLWKPRIDTINYIWPKIERATVLTDIRQGGLQNVSPDNLMELQDFCFSNGIGYAILSREGSSGTYSNASHPVKPGRPWLYRVYFGATPDRFLEAWRASDQLAVGEFLGYPQCCTEFFSHWWQEEGWRDLTYPMFKNNLRTAGPYECNILLRHLGVRATFHLPCSFTCEPSKTLADNILSYRDMGYEREIDWLIEILNWPVKWSSLHGVAMTTTPVVKVISTSDALGEKVELERDGNYPEGGVSGNEFLTARQLNLVMQDNWTDNGFSSHFAMKRAHSFILNMLYNIPSGAGSVIDLGCGNGALLHKIVKDFSLIPYGVESDPKKFVQVLLGHIHLGNIYDYKDYLDTNHKIALISVNRLSEVESLKASLLLEALRRHVQYLVVYSYEPWGFDIDQIVRPGFSQLHSGMDGHTEVRIFKSNENQTISTR
jgi:hypothetical protein